MYWDAKVTILSISYRDAHVTNNKKSFLCVQIRQFTTQRSRFFFKRREKSEVHQGCGLTSALQHHYWLNVTKFLYLLNMEKCLFTGVLEGVLER